MWSSGKWSAPLSLLCFYLCMFVSVDTHASIPDLEDLIEVKVLISQATDVSSRMSGKIVVTPNTDEPLEITHIETHQFEMYDEYSDKRDAYIPIIQRNPSPVVVKEDFREAETLYPTTELVLGIEFSPPLYNGLYKESIEVFWRYPGADYEIGVKDFISYSIENRQISFLSNEELEKLAHPTTIYKAISNGEEITIIEKEGFADPSPYKGEKEDEADLDDDNKPFIVPFDYESDKNPIDRDTEQGGSSTKSVLSLRYCTRLRFYDEYENYPTNTTGMKWWRPKGDSSLRNVQGLYFQLWDKDSSGEDDYIGAWWTSYTGDGGYTCANFTWDQSARGEDYPDVYVKATFTVKDVEFDDSDKKNGTLCNNGCTCTALLGVSWRTNYWTDFGEDETEVHTSFTFSPAGTELNAQAMQINALQKFLRTWRSRYMTHRIKVDWVQNGWPSATNSRDCIILSYKSGLINTYRRWDAPAHEAGHAYQWQLLNNMPTGYSVSEHHGYCSYYDFFAMHEGWAHFVAMRSWYPDSKGTSQPIYPSSEGAYQVEPGGYTFLSGKDPTHSNCGDFADLWCSTLNCEDCYSKNEMMVLRAFWDIWDNSVDGVDASDITLDWDDMAEIWTLYPETGNGNRYETDTNMIDYLRNSALLDDDAYDDIATVYAEDQTDMECQYTGSGSDED